MNGTYIKFNWFRDETHSSLDAANAFTKIIKNRLKMKLNCLIISFIYYNINIYINLDFITDERIINLVELLINLF